MQNINATVNKAAAHNVEALLNMYVDDLQQAYMEAQGPLTVSISMKFKQGDTQDDMEVETFIAFTRERIKDSMSRIVNESQGVLFDEEKD